MRPGQEVEILSMASLPQKPVSPNPFAFAACGLGAGLLLGLLTATAIWRPKSTLRVAGFAAAGGALAFGLSWLLPEAYTSTAVLRLDPPYLVPERLVGAVSGGPVGERFQRLAQEVLNPEHLASLISARGLYPEERARKSLEEVAGIMRRNIAIRRLGPPTALPGATGAFSLSFSYSDNIQAQRVAGSLAASFVERNAAETRVRIEATKNAEVHQLIEQGLGKISAMPHFPDLPGTVGAPNIGARIEETKYNRIRNLIDRGLVDRLEILDAATLPDKPNAPNRLAIAAAGLALGLLLGALAPRLRRRTRAPQVA
jgi:hypothetical protein